MPWSRMVPWSGGAGALAAAGTQPCADDAAPTGPSVASGRVGLPPRQAHAAVIGEVDGPERVRVGLLHRVPAPGGRRHHGSGGEVEGEGPDQGGVVQALRPRVLVGLVLQRQASGQALVAGQDDLGTVVLDDEPETFLRVVDHLEGARVVHVEDNRATVRYPFSDSPLYIQPGEAASLEPYPGWRAMFRYEPSDRPMSAELLPPADRMAALSLGGDFGGMRFYPTIECGPIYVRVPAWPNFFGIVMPIKPFRNPDDDATLTAKPGWLPGVK